MICLIIILTFSSRVVAIISLSIGGLGALLIWILQNRIGSELSQTFWVAFGSLPALSLLIMLSSVLRALKRVVISASLSSLLRPALQAGSLTITPRLVAIYAIGWRDCFRRQSELSPLCVSAALLLSPLGADYQEFFVVGKTQVINIRQFSDLAMSALGAYQKILEPNHVHQ